MKLEQQLTSLEISKKLKELGVKQESLFYFAHKGEIRSGKSLMDSYFEDTMGMPFVKWLKEVNGGEIYSAFTVAELGEMLPNELTKGGWGEWNNRLEIHMLVGEESAEWVVEYGAGDAFAIATKATTEADARGKMLIYLLDHNLTKHHEEKS